MELDEAVGRRDRLRRLVVLVVRVGDLDLRLLREAAVRIARLELLVVLDRLLVVAVVEVVLGLAYRASARTSPWSRRRVSASRPHAGDEHARAIPLNYDRMMIMARPRKIIAQTTRRRRRVELTVPRRLRGLRLDQALARLLPEYRAAGSRAGCATARVTVDGRPARAAARRCAAASASTLAPAARSARARRTGREDIPLAIVHEDDDAARDRQARRGSSCIPGAGNWAARC